MKKIKSWLIVALALIVIGGIIFTGVMMVLNWDFKKISTVKYETNSYEFEDFNNINITTSTAKIIFKPSTDGKNRVVCFEDVNEKHRVTLNEDLLTITEQNTKKWYQYIGIDFNSPSITLYLDKSEYGDLFIKASTGNLEIPNNFIFKDLDVTFSTGDVKINSKKLGELKVKTSTGDITVENASVKSLELTASTGEIVVNNLKSEGDVNIMVSTGKTNLSDISCKNFNSKGSTGKISLKNVIANEKISIERDTGEVKLDKCDGAEINITTDTGNVSGSLKSEKVFIVKTHTGSVKVPETVTGGKCEITTDTGDIQIVLDK